MKKRAMYLGIVLVIILLPITAKALTFVQDSVRVDQGAAGKYAYAAGIASCPNGRFAIVWSDADFGALARIYDQNGNPLTNQFKVEDVVNSQGLTGGAICDTSNNMGPLKSVWVERSRK